MRKLWLMSSMAAMALMSATGVQAASSIQFDTNGSAPGGVITVDTFDWAPDNALIVNGATPGTTTVQVVAQASLSTFITATTPQTFTSPAPGTEYTFQLTMTETVTGIGTSSVALTPTSGTLNIYYDPTADANQLAGTGYGGGGDAVLILTGSIVPGPSSNGTFTDLTLLSPASFPLSPLDQFTGAGTNYPNVLSDTGSGNTNLAFHVTFADPTFFLSDITTLVIGLQDSSNNTTPFKQADPAAQVVGITPVFTSTAGGLVNGQPNQCAQGVRCDFLIQTDASSSFNPTSVPEPGTLALLSLGLLGAGFTWRRKMH